jgi:hypothetical protein
MRISIFALFELKIETSRSWWYKIGCLDDLTSEERDVDTDYLPGCAIAPVLRDVSEMLQPTPVQVLGDRTAGADAVSGDAYADRTAALFDVKIRGTDQGCRIKETSSPD